MLSTSRSQNGRGVWLVFFCTLGVWGLEPSLAAAQAEKPAAKANEAKQAPAATNPKQAQAPSAPPKASADTTAPNAEPPAPAGNDAGAPSEGTGAESHAAEAPITEGEVIEKVPAVAPPPEEAKKADTAASQAQATPTIATSDELSEPGYLPGYRRYIGLGQSPHSPPVGALPGGFTPGYGAPMPTKNWTFTFSGSANVSAQYTGMKRRGATPDQSGFALHTPPRAIEEYSSFTSSSTVPGHWVSLRFTYGTPKVAAIMTLDTWNPTVPTSYYQMGSQSYVNNAYMAFSPEPIGKVRLRINAGQLTTNYGMLSKYGGGVYVNPMGAILRGIGETVIAEYDLTDKLTLSAEHGFMATRDGTPPTGYYAQPSNGYRRQYWAGAFANHAHLGLQTKGAYALIAELHFFDLFYQDERAQSPADNPQTPQIDESYVRDPRVRVIAGDVKVEHESFGMLSLGLSYTDSKYSYGLKGFMTYGGDGEWLTDRWFGVTTSGTGKLFVTALNYSFSLGRIINYPAQFSGNGPDLVVNTGVHWTKTWTDFEPYDGRVRWKGAFDAVYTLIRYMGIGARIDHIVPNSYDSGETYNVLATRLQFKTDWTSRETLSLIYAKWFYGPRTRNEGTGLRTPDRLDDHLFALNFNIWW